MLYHIRCWWEEMELSWIVLVISISCIHTFLPKHPLVIGISNTQTHVVSWNHPTIFQTEPNDACGNIYFSTATLLVAALVMQIVRRILMTHDVAGDKEGVVGTKSSHTRAKVVHEDTHDCPCVFLRRCWQNVNFMLRYNKICKSTFSE